jgi:hypothetical protein
VREWDVYNGREQGGIAKPSVFITDRDGSVRYASVDSLASRVPAEEIERVFSAASSDGEMKRRGYMPRPAEIIRAIRNSLRR